MTGRHQQYIVMLNTCSLLALAGTIPGIDLVQPLLFQVWNEGASAYLDANVAKYNPAVDTASPDFEEGNLKHSINGYLYCNMPDVSSLWLPQTVIPRLHVAPDPCLPSEVSKRVRWATISLTCCTMNIPQIHVKQGKTVRFMQLAMGTENDMVRTPLLAHRIPHTPACLDPAAIVASAWAVKVHAEEQR